MKPKYIYLAEPIDQAPAPSTMSRAAIDRMRAVGLPFYAPRDAWWYPPQVGISNMVQVTNNVALGGSAVLLAVLPKGVRTHGVPMEVERAHQAKVPIVILSDIPRHLAGAFGHIDVCGWTPSPVEAVTACARVFGTPPAEAAARQAAEVLGPNVARWVSRALGSLCHPEAPRAGHEGDAGYDLVVSVDCLVPKGKRIQVPCSIAIQLPDGYWGLIQGRSSSWKNGLLVKGSVIDAGYRGEIWVDVWAMPDPDAPEAHEIKAGSRIAQLIPMPLVPRLDWQQVLFLDESARGANGYGSSGA